MIAAYEKKIRDENHNQKVMVPLAFPIILLVLILFRYVIIAILVMMETRNDHGTVREWDQIKERNKERKTKTRLPP
jgi:hypothetical protein